MRGQAGRQRSDWDHFADEQRKLCKHNRDTVLAHPAVAARLTRPPLSYAKPEQWNGYVPPYLWNGQVNNSSRRAALIDIITAAEKATKEAS